MTSELLRLCLRLCASNGAMMLAWFLLVPVPMVVWLAVFASHALASLEYAIQVPANATAYERKLGLVMMRAPQEVVMFLAFVAICLLAQQQIYIQQLFAFPLIVLAAALIVMPSVNKRQIGMALSFIAGACIIAVTFFRLPHVTNIAQNNMAYWDVETIPWFLLLAVTFITVSSLLITLVYVPALKQQVRIVKKAPRLTALLLELALIGLASIFVRVLTSDIPQIPLLIVGLIMLLCFVPNSFMIVAWYGHTQIKPRGFMAKHPLMFKYLVAWGTAFLEYSFLIPLLRFAYQYLSIFQLFGLMEFSTIIVFLYFVHITTKHKAQKELTKSHVALYLSLIAIEVAFCLVG